MKRDIGARSYVLGVECGGDTNVVLNSTEFIDDAVRELNAIGAAATLDFALAVGKLIVDRFYSGDLSRWRARGPKDCSFRKLAQHPALTLSAGSLCRSVGIYELCERLQSVDLRCVSATHLRAVLGLAPELQESMLAQAIAGGWSARRLELEVAPTRSRSRRGDTRHRTRFWSTIRVLERYVDAEGRFDGAEESHEEPSPESARKMIDALERVKLMCSKLEHRLSCRLPSARSDPPPKA